MQDVVDGLISLREAARKLGVHPAVFCKAVGRLREEKQRQQAAATVLSFIDAL